MAKRYIYLVRHGQREPGVCDDPLGPRLTELGWKQAHQAARRLAGLNVDVIHSSSLRRAMDTAQILAVEHPDIPIRPSRLLWECVPAFPANVLEWFQSHPEINPEIAPAEVRPWISPWSVTDQRQIKQDIEQARLAWSKFFLPAKGKERHDIVVCHGNLIRYFIARALQAPAETWLNMEIYNCSISEIIIEDDGRPMLISFNESGHLHPDQVTLF